ncbi:N-6 DNA methylase [Hymenobacter guriensis]|uniref:N-6 DNA methylase n=1 Tax=Hymenobacter guriensis TaxID=2793065 RepID=A0ABS0KZD3_9BACT|nr:N-6 DNA methylase [Hymenobacter guriensis]MBG8552569.1 N-6 DNA methylase [Hymenobacter guriensis]
MQDLRNITDWKNSIGLLPIKLFSESTSDSNFILLNGGKGDFCLQTAGDTHDDNYYYSSSWSSNTKNYVSVCDDHVKLYNWRNKKVEKINKKIILDNYSKFYDYIVKTSLNSQYDIIPFVISIFRKLRNLENDKSGGIRSLNLLFLLLASYNDDVAFNEIDKSTWGIQDIDFINPEFERYVQEFSKGLLGQRPDIDLIIRHSSGLLFQEAQKEALFFDKNLDLFTGTLSSNYKTRKLLYSSVHYTPAYIARTIVENALNAIDLASINNLKILDPSCGSAEFLMEILKQLKSRNYNGNVTVIGWDTSISAINTAKFLLTYEKREWSNRLSLDIRLVDDSLSEDWDNDYDFILMNPPFVSWDQMPKEARDTVKETLGAAFNGKPNQASAFFFKAVECLKPSGVIGCVIPTSLFSLSSYKEVRSRVSDSMSFSLIGKLGNFVFEDALADISILVGQKPKSNILPLLVWTRNEKGVVSDTLRDLRKLQYENLPSIDHRDYSIYTPDFFPLYGDNWKPIPLRENRLFKNIERFVIERSLTRIGDIFSTQQGVRTGNNSVFKISSGEYLALNDNEKLCFRPVIDNNSIKNGILVKDNYVWYPYSGSGLIIENENELISKASWFYHERLLPNKQLLEARPSLSKNKKWWELSEPRSWQFERKSMLCSTEFGRSDSFAFDIKNEFVIERGYGWLPKKKMSDNDKFFYLALFSSPLFDSLLSIYSKQLSGIDGWDLGKQYTRNIPIPNVFLNDLTESVAYRSMVNFGRAMSDGNFYSPNLINEIVTQYLYPYSL